MGLAEAMARETEKGRLRDRRRARAFLALGGQEALICA